MEEGYHTHTTSYHTHMRRGSFLNTIFGGGTASAHPPPAPSSSAIATTASHQHAGTAEPAARPPSVPVAVASPTARRRAASHSDLMARHPLIAAAPSGAGRPASGQAEGRRCAPRRQGGQTEQKRQKKQSKKTRPRSLSSGSACTRDGVRTSGALLAADSTAISTAVYAWGASSPMAPSALAPAFRWRCGLRQLRFTTRTRRWPTG